MIKFDKERAYKIINRCFDIFEEETFAVKKTVREDVPCLIVSSIDSSGEVHILYFSCYKYC